MTTYDDDRLVTRFRELASEPLAADWLDVQRRARRGGRRRLLTLAAATLVATTLVGSALAFRAQIEDFLSFAPAEPRVVQRFDQLDKTSRYEWGTGVPVIATEAREILRTSRPDGSGASLAVAPMRGGGFCVAYDIRGEAATEGSTCVDGKTQRSDPGIGLDSYFAGTVTVPGTDHLVLRYADGAEDRIPVVWVSQPIDAGFFAFDAPDGRDRAEELVAVDAEGRALAREAVNPGPPPGSPSPGEMVTLNVRNDLRRDVSVWKRPLRIDRSGVQGRSWYREAYRLRPGDGLTMTPWPGRHEVALTAVGAPISKALARLVVEVGAGDRVELRATGGDTRSARLVIAARG